MTGDRYVGRGSRQRNLPKSRYCNIYKVAEHGRASALTLYQQHLDSSAELKRSIWTLTGCRLLCHCTKSQDCHADILIREFKNSTQTHTTGRSWDHHRLQRRCCRFSRSSDVNQRVMTVHLQMKVLHQKGQDSVEMVLLCKLVLATLQENFVMDNLLIHLDDGYLMIGSSRRQIGGWVS